ncbi:hypothetical protein JCM14720_10680 [Calditerricola yamamurae]
MPRHVSQSLRTVRPSRQTVVPLPVGDAQFLCRRARAQQRRKAYAKAVRLLERALQLQPDDAEAWYQLAEVLAEAGRFAESNEALWRLQELCPQWADVWYFLASNYAYLGAYEEAEACALRYLEREPQGEYAALAHDLLEMVYEELHPADGPGVPPQHGSILQRHEHARALLEAGRFHGAQAILEDLVKAHPEFLPARNNLALAYYYTGRLEQAVATAEAVLAHDPHNIYALCNLAVFCVNLGDWPRLVRLTQQLVKLVPLQPEAMYKLATTLGLLGEHAHARFLFRKLLYWARMEEAPLLHFAAVAEYNTGHPEAARRLWEKAVRLSGDPVAAYYLQVMEEVDAGMRAAPDVLPYQHQIPLEAYEQVVLLAPQDLPEGLRNDPLVRASYLWALRFGDEATKRRVIEALAQLGDSEGEAALRQFLRDPDEADDLKVAAFLALLSRGGDGRLATPGDGAPEAEGVVFTPFSLVADWPPAWQEVLRLLMVHCGADRHNPVYREAVAVWCTYVFAERPEPRRIRKPAAWAAAVEYVAAQRAGQPVKQKELAARYGVASSAVSRIARLLRVALAKP